MKSDKYFYAIFFAFPEWIFELAQLKSPGTCAMRSMTFKALEQQTDSVIVPDEVAEPITVVEYQCYYDKRIYNRTAVAMSLAQDAFDGREVQGFIFFRSRNLDPQTEPWRRIIQSFTFEEMLESLAARSPEHPLVAVFQPLLQKDEQVLEANARHYYHQIRVSELDDDRKETLLNVFVGWLQQRFTNKGFKEIEMLLIDDLPELEDTKSGRELIEIGIQRGLDAGFLKGARMALLCQLEAKFGSVPPDLQTRIESVDSAEQLTHLTRQAVKVESLSDLQWH